MKEIVIFNAIMNIAARNASGRVRVGQVADCFPKRTGITRYAVRKMFRELRDYDILDFCGNHDKINGNHPLLSDLMSNTVAIVGVEMIW